MVTRHGLFLKWKIQPKRHPKPELVMETLRKNILDDLILQTVVTGIAYKFLSLGKKGPKDATSVEDKQNNDQATCQTQGWACLRFDGRAPSAFTHVWQVAVGYLGFDFMFYWSHRLMHDKRLYKHCHKIHHQYHSSIGLACAHEHPIESFVQLLAWWLPIGFAGFMNRHNGGLHVSTIVFHHCFRWLETVDSHSGYEFPFSPMHVLPFFGGARRHDYHHREFDGNYGATLFWDWLCGTDKPFWQEVAENGGFMLGGGVTLR
jgi:sterol desaturase/sphingolipid hydroxylase (fatty acid hydroxylase superfamily)